MAPKVGAISLVSPKNNYDQARKAFVTHLERHTNHADTGLESVRWIATTLTADQLYRDLAQKIDKNDRLFVSRVKQTEYSGFLNQATINWLAAKV